MSTPRLLACLLLACVTAAFRPAAGADADYENREFGFALRPPSGWVCFGSDGEAPVLRQVYLYPRGAKGAPCLLVQVSLWDGRTDAAAIRDAAVAALAGRAGYGTMTSLTATLAGRPAPALGCTVTTAAGGPWRAECRYLVAQGFVYAVTLTREPEDDAAVRTLEEAAATFRLLAGVDAALRALAGRCGRDLPWARTWDEAAARARAEGRLVFLLFEHYAVLEIPHTFASGALMDPDVAALVRERFVPLRVGPTDPTPLSDPARYGLSKSSWGTTLFFVTPEGRVVGAPVTLTAPCVDQAARAALAALPGAAAASAPPTLAGARAALARGELAAAAPMLRALAGGTTGAERARAFLLMATLYRRERASEKALAFLAAARDGAPPELRPEIAAEEARVLQRLARLDEAEGEWRALAEAAPPGPAATEARFWLGAIALARTGDLKGGGHWARLVAEAPDDRWAWKAAANLVGIGAYVQGMEPLNWPDEGDLDAIAPGRPAPLAVEEAARAEGDALAYLLRTQHTDGSWPNAESVSWVRVGYAEATTSICGASLVPFADRPEARAGAERGLAWVRAALGGRGESARGGLAATYRVWAETFALRFLVRCRAAGVGPRAELGPEIEALVRALAARQLPGGGWPYASIAADPKGEGLASSFLSAAILLVLDEARAGGAEVPAEVRARGAQFLQGLRNDDGSFRYFPEDPPGSGGAGAAGRSPLCALALSRAGAEDLPGIRRALDLFVHHQPTLEAERGKDLCHTGPEGQAAYYFFYDHAFAAAAVRALPAAEQPALARTLRARILAARSEDGSFVDLPALGRPYATAMALDALGSLR